MPEGMVVVKMVESNVQTMPTLPKDIDFNTVGLNSISPGAMEAEFNYDPYMKPFFASIASLMVDFLILIFWCKHDMHATFIFLMFALFGGLCLTSIIYLGFMRPI